MGWSWGYLTLGQFNYSQLNNIQAYYGLALIETYNDESKLEGFGLYVDKNISDKVIIFDKVSFTEKFEFVILCKSMNDLYSKTNGILPIDINLLFDTDDYHRIEEDLRFLREIQFLKNNHPSDKVKMKYLKVYDIYKSILPLFFKTFEEEGFLPFAINPNYTGVINPFELLSEQELKLKQ